MKSVNALSTSHNSWLDSINWQIDFVARSRDRCRNDLEFEWEWFEKYDSGSSLLKLARRFATSAARRFGTRQEFNFLQWLQSRSGLLWEVRCLLEDDLSKLLFDSSLVLRSTSHRQFYFPRIDFEDFVEISNDQPFQNQALPTNYLGLPLRIFDLRIKGHSSAPSLKIITTKEQLRAINNYRQYLIRRNTIDVSPVRGDVVLDCGACIGEISLLFSGLVAPEGQVHLFEPVPLHARFCELQASLNPCLTEIININVLAVGARTENITGQHEDSATIAPGGLAIDSFAMTSLDDYAAAELDRVDFIKMDIEGAEIDAIQGAANVIRSFKPRLAISAYHRPDDLWGIPQLLKSINPDYKLFFGHHSPVQWESVYYAV